MKLKTKFQDEAFDLGEVVEANVYSGDSGKIELIVEPTRGGMITFYFGTLKEMNEMFEDYEEPKKYWAIDIYSKGVENFTDSNDYVDEFNKEIGNHFGTREETEKAIEKLKAITRLEDKGFRFDGYDVANRGGDNVICGQAYFKAGDYCIGDVEKDLALLFCTEDD